MDNLISNSPNWIKECWNQSHPPKEPEIFDNFKNSNGTYKPFNKVDWNRVYKTTKRILKV